MHIEKMLVLPLLSVAQLFWFFELVPRDTMKILKATLEFDGIYRKF